MADEQRNEKVLYVVKVVYSSIAPHLDEPVLWGPFADFDMAQQCVVEMASREDVVQAIIDEAEMKKPFNVEDILPRHKGQG